MQSMPLRSARSLSMATVLRTPSKSCCKVSNASFDGLHKSGVAYDWPDGYPVADDLPEISTADIESFLNALRGGADGHEGLLQREGCALTQKSARRVGQLQKRHPIGHKPFMAPSPDVIVEALKG